MGLKEERNALVRESPIGGSLVQCACWLVVGITRFCVVLKPLGQWVTSSSERRELEPCRRLWWKGEIIFSVVWECVLVIVKLHCVQSTHPVDSTTAKRSGGCDKSMPISDLTSLSLKSHFQWREKKLRTWYIHGLGYPWPMLCFKNPN